MEKLTAKQRYLSLKLKYNTLMAKTPKGMHVTLRERIGFALSAANSYLIVSFASTYLVFFYTDILLVNPTFVFVLMLIARLWDSVTDLMMGLVIERTRTKLGRMIPYLRYFSLPMAISVVLIFSPISGGNIAKMVYVSLTYMTFGLMYTITDIPLWGLMSVATPNEKERAGLLSFSATIGAIGALLPMLTLPVLVRIFGEKGWAYFCFSVIVGVFSLFTMLSLSYKTKERIAPPKDVNTFRQNLRIARKNRPMIATIAASILACTRYLMQLAGIYVATYVLVLGSLEAEDVLLLLYMVVGVGMLAGMLLTPVFYKKFGYKRTFISGGVISATSLLVAYIIGYSSFYTMVPFMILGGYGLGVFNVITYPMVGDSLDYLEWKTGERIEGFCFSVQSFMTKFNQAFAAIALTLALVVVNFIQPDTSGVPLPQEDSTIKGLYALVTLLPAIGFALSIIPMLFYNYTGELRTRIKAELAERRAAAENADAAQ